MKKIALIISILSIFASSCTTTYKPIINFSKPVTGTQYEDESFVFSLGEAFSCSRLNYKIQNKTTTNLEIDWNRASFVLGDGEAFRIYEGEMKGIDKNKEQLFQIIPPSAFKKGVIVSGKGLSYSEYAGWTADCFFNGNPKSFKGKTMKLAIPIKINNDFKTFNFELIISEVKASKENMLLH